MEEARQKPTEQQQQGEKYGWTKRTDHTETPVTQKIPEKLFIKKSSEEYQDETNVQPGSSPNTPVLTKSEARSVTLDPPKDESCQCSGSASEEEAEEREYVHNTNEHEKNETSCEDAGTKEPKFKSTMGLVVGWVNQKMKDQYQRRMEKSLRREEENGNKFYVICTGGIIREVRVAKVEQEKRWHLDKKEKRRHELEDRFNKWEEKMIQKKADKKEKKKERRRQELERYFNLLDEEENKQKAKKEEKRKKKEEKKKRKETENKPKGLLEHWRKWQKKKVENTEKKQISQTDLTSQSEEPQTESPPEAQEHSEPRPVPFKCKARIIFVQPINPIPEPTDESHQYWDFLYTENPEPTAEPTGYATSKTRVDRELPEETFGRSTTHSAPSVL